MNKNQKTINDTTMTNVNSVYIANIKEKNNICHFNVQNIALDFIYNYDSHMYFLNTQINLLVNKCFGKKVCLEQYTFWG